MSGRPPDPGPDAPDDSDGHSARESVHEVRRGLHEHLHARVELLSLEFAEARTALGQKSALGITLLLAAFFAYALLLVAAVALLGRWFTHLGSGMGWELATLLAGLLHAAVATAIILRLTKKSGPPLFEYTRAEFQKDREWLQPHQSSNESENSS